MENTKEPKSKQGRRPFVDESTYSQRRINRFFENEFYDPSQIKSSFPEPGMVMKAKPAHANPDEPGEDDWEVKTTSKGFVYFKPKGNNNCQWEFPRVYNYKTKKYKSIYMKDWVRLRNPQTGAVMWKNSETGFTQTVDPKSVTYVFEAAMNNNIAFIEFYFRYGGNINLVDQKKRTPLHHA